MRRRITFCGDVHVANHSRFGGIVRAGLNERCSSILGALGRARFHALDLRSDSFCVLGDLFDTVDPTPQIVAAVMAALEGDGKQDLEKIFLLGNHEQVSTQPGDHALGPLRSIGHVLERWTSGDGMTYVPFIPGAFPEKLEEALEAFHDTRLLCFHAGISDERTPIWLKDAEDSINVNVLAKLCVKYGVKHVIAGNWHNRIAWSIGGVDILQLGALVPTGFDNPGLDGYGGVATWTDGESGFEVRELPGPRFVKVYSAIALAEVTAAAVRKECPLYAQIVVPASEVEEARAAVETLSSQLAGYEVVPDKKEVAQSLSVAAQAAISAETLNGALSSYVGALMVGRAQEEREAVLIRTRKYLGI